MIETCFAEPADYWREGGRPTRWYPGYVRPPGADVDPPAHTFEVRRRGPVTIRTGLVAAVADESWFSGRERLRRSLQHHVKQLGAEWWPPRQGERAQVAAARYVERFLQKRGLAW